MHRLNSITFSFILTVILSTLLMLGGCSREGENIPTAYPTVISELDAGWDSFQKAQYTSAIEHFTNAKDRDAAKIEAFNGLGWSYTRLGNYIESEQNFKLMLALSNEADVQANGNAGLAFNYFATPVDMAPGPAFTRDGIAIDYAQKALALKSDYAFEHDSNVNTASLYALIAECRFNRQEYLLALTNIETHLSPGFTANLVGSGVLVEVVNEAVEVSIGTETQLTGRAKLNIDAELVKINMIQNLDQNVEYLIESFDEGGGSITFSGNPIPQKKDQFLVSYYYAPNYGKFLTALMNQLRQSL